MHRFGNSRAAMRLDEMVEGQRYSRKVAAYINGADIIISALTKLPPQIRKKVGADMIRHRRLLFKNDMYDLIVPTQVLSHVHQVCLERIRDKLIRDDFWYE